MKTAGIGLLLLAGILWAQVDINHAKTKELMALHGIGKKKARAIVRYRKKHCFEEPRDIIKVKGIGKKIFQKNRHLIVAGSCDDKKAE